LGRGTEGILHGGRIRLLQDDAGNIEESYSISAGLDYPGVGPELCHLQEQGRILLGHATDTEALDAFQFLCRTEGILPALESSHALAYAKRLARGYSPDDVMIINLSGNGGKDLGIITEALGLSGAAAEPTTTERMLGIGGTHHE
jgi:tryptophan synthase beta chain